MLQKTYKDYIEEVYKQFPDIEEKCIEDIVVTGLKNIYANVKTGADVFIKSKKFYTFIGTHQKESLEQWINSKFKEHNKRRRMFRQSKKVWDGFFYFGLTELENNEFIEKGKLPSINMYKLMKECAIRKDIRYIYKTKFKVSYMDEWRWIFKKTNYSLRRSKLSTEGMLWMAKRAEWRAIKLQRDLANEENNPK